MQRFRDPVSGLMHLGAALIALPGAISLPLLASGGLAKQFSLLVYGLSLVLLFSASAAYHLVLSPPQVILRLRKLDHAAIYLLIAGTYTPICLQFFSGFWREGLLALVWGMALVGVVQKLIFMRTPRWLSAGLYLLMGWMALLGLSEMINSLPAGAFGWLLAGGAFFSLGALVYIFKKPDLFPQVFGFHELWHVFVILGCVSHFIAIAAYVVPAPVVG